MKTSNNQFYYKFWDGKHSTIIGVVGTSLFIIIFIYLTLMNPYAFFLLVLAIGAMIAILIELKFTVKIAPQKIIINDNAISIYWDNGRHETRSLEDVKEININRRKRITSQFTIRIIFNDNTEILVGEKITGLNKLIKTILDSNPNCTHNIDFDELYKIEHKYL